MPDDTPSSEPRPSHPSGSASAADPDRLQALHRYDILDSAPEDTFDRIADLAAALFDAPIGLITFVDDDRQWHKACVGFDVPELDLDTSFCVHALEDAQRLVVEDATDDERFVDNPLVTGDRHVRFYAGAPMITPDGHVLGTVCVLDTEPRSPTEEQLDQLDSLAQMAVDQLEQRRRHKIEKAEQVAATEASESRLNELLAALDDVVWEVQVRPDTPNEMDTTRLKLLYTNSAEERIYGRPTSAFIQDPALWRSAAHPQDQADLPTVEALLAEGGWQGEYRLLQPNGTARWVKTSIQVVGRPPVSAAGEVELDAPVKLAGVTRDIHRRKQAEASLQENSDALAEEKTRLQMALDAADAGVFEWFVPEDRRVWDERVQHLFGLDAAPDTTGALLEHVHPDDRTHLQEMMSSALGNAEKQTCQVGYRVRRPDGSARRVQARGTVERNDAGEAIRMIGVYRDVTEQRNRREGLRRSERRFEAVFNDPNLFAGLLDLDGTLRAVNETALSRIDGGRDDVVGTPFWETPWWNHDAALQADLQEWIERAAGGEYVSYQSEHITGDEPRYTIRGSIRPVTDEDGTVTSLIASGRDVTAREDQRRELEILREAIEDAADGVAIVSDGEYMYVDQTHVDMYGFDSKEQLLGEPWQKLYSEQEVERLEKTAFPILHEEGYWQGSVVGSRPDGSTFPAEISLTMTGNDRLVCTVRDVTERRERARKRRLLLTASETGIAEWNLRTGRVQWDGMLRELFGRAPETFEEFAQLIHPDDRPRVEAHLESVVEDVTSWSGEFRIEDGDGRTRWVSTMVIPIFEEGGVARVLATGNDVTDRKEREQELRLKERAMDEANVGIQITDATQDDNPLVYVNEGFEEQTGYDRDEVLGRNSRFLQGPDTDAATIETLRTAVANDEPVTVEIQNYRKDGSSYWNRLSLAPVHDDDGTLRNYVGIQQDVTERRRRTEMLEDRQRKLDLVLSGTETGLAEWTPRTDEFRLDETLQALFGVNPETFDAFADLVHPEDRDGMATALRDMIDTGEPWNGEFRVETGSGEIAWVEARVAPIHEEGEPVRALGTATDITERKEREARLRMLSAAVEQAKESILITEGTPPSGESGRRIEYVNTAYQEMSGYTKEEILGETPGILQGEDTDPAVIGSLTEALQAEEEWAGETVNYRKDGTPYTVQWNVSPVRGKDGSIEHWVSVQRDVTDEREREEALEESRERYRTLLQAAPDPILVADADTGEVVEANGAAEALLGRAREDIVGLHQTDLHPEQRAEAYRTLFEDSFKESGTRTALSDGTQIEVLTAEGDTVPVEINAGMARLPQGPVVYGVFRDISKRKAMQAELTRQERRFRMMFEQHSAPMLLTDEATGAIEDANEAAADFYGYDRPTLTSMSIQDINQLPADEVARKRSAAAAADGEELLFEHEQASGEIRTVRVLSAPVPNPSGGTLLFSVIHDITEREERRQDLEDRKEVLRQILDSIDEVFYLLDESGDLLLWNDSLNEVTGYTDAELEAMTAVDLFEDDELARIQSAIDEAFTSGHARIDASLVPNTGAPIPHELTGSVFEDPERGRVLCGVGRDVTEQRAQQDALQRANRRFEQFAEAVPNAFIIVTPDYSELLYANSAVESLYGVDVDTLRDDPGAWTRYVHPADLAALQSDMDAQVHREADWPQRQEFRVLHPTRGRRWLTVRLHAIRDEEGALQRIAGVATDVTERKVREQRLRALHRTTRDLLDVTTEAGAASIVTDTLGDTLGFEEAGVYLRDGDTLVRRGRTDGEVVAPLPRIEKGHTPLWTALETGEPQTYADPSAIDDEVDRSGVEACAYLPVGPHGVLVVGTDAPNRLDDDEVRLVEVLARSLRETLDALDRERDLVVGERRYRTLAENVPNGAVLLFDDTLTYTLAAGELIEEYDLGESGFIGEQVGTVLTEEHPSLVDRYRAALEGERTDQRVEIGDRTLRVHIVPLRGESESAGLLLAQDVTEEARRERELVDAREAAEEASRMKSALLANMSHEIRTPLTSILGFAEIVGEEADAAGPVARFAGLIEKSGRRLMDTLDSVLNLAKLESGSVLSEEPVDLSAEAQSIVDELQSAADEKDIALSVDTGEGAVWARADTGGVGLIARNLVKNAIKYTDDGGTVQVRVHAEDDAAVIEVEDTGIGIDEAVAAQIFEPFRQESEGFGREYEGVGLGLSIAKEAVDQMDGTIEVESEKGEGSRFIVRLPGTEASPEGTG